MNIKMNVGEICRCCHTPGKHKSFEIQYTVDGVDEIYSLMLRNILGVEIQNKQDVSSSICEVCIYRLKQAMAFKSQVLNCEEKLLQYLSSLNEPQIKEEIIDDKVEIFVDTEYDDPEAIEDTDVKDENLTVENLDEVIVKDKNKAASNNVKKRRKFKNKVHQDNKSNNNLPDRRCHICLELQPSLTILRKHVDKHKTYICEYCQSTYSDRTTILCHIRQHLGLIEFRCKICSKVYQHRSSLREHLLRHNGTYLNIVCDYCAKRFGNKTELQRHIDSIHLKLKNIPCPVCDAKFSIKKNLKSHMQKVHNSLPEKGKRKSRTATFLKTCSVCNRPFKSASNYVDHMLLKHKNSILENELLKLYPDVGEKYECQYCPAKYYNSLNLNRHMAKHKIFRGKSHFCEFCSQTFSSKYVLERHKLSHSGIKTVKCHMCEKSYYHKESLKKHMASFHSKVQTAKEKVKCTECARSVYNLEEHLKCHRNKPFKCDICHSSYSKINTLNRHKEKHNGVRYNCDTCSKTYLSKSKMLLHRKNVHLKVEEAE